MLLNAILILFLTNALVYYSVGCTETAIVCMIGYLLTMIVALLKD